MVRTAAPGDATETAKRAATEGWDAILVLGGDGTVHEVANGLIAAGTNDPPAVGVLPIGTGNDFARMTGTRGLNVPRAVTALAAGRVVRIDVGVAWDEVFVNSLGIGLAAEAAFRVNRMQHFGGVAAYLLGVVQTMWSYQPQETTVQAEGLTVTGPLLALEVVNGLTSGGGFRLAPASRPDDGLLDYCLIEPLGKVGMMTKLPKAIRGTHGAEPEVTLGRTTQLTIRSGVPLRAHLDGECRDPGETTMTVTIRPAALRALVAPGSLLPT
jgi:YegS/Rv2252/BmrU family lipid kinase